MKKLLLATFSTMALIAVGTTTVSAAEQSFNIAATDGTTDVKLDVLDNLTFDLNDTTPEKTALDKVFKITGSVFGKKKSPDSEQVTITITPSTTTGLSITAPGAPIPVTNFALQDIDKDITVTLDAKNFDWSQLDSTTITVQAQLGATSDAGSSNQ